MAFPNQKYHPTIITLLPVLLCIAPLVRPQNLRSGPTISQCGTGLLPLAPCAPFVQGRASSPAQSCCVNLRQVYDQQPACLCLLLNQTTLTAFPSINQTLALQLPFECNLQVDTSICSGAPPPPSLPSTSPPSQDVSLGSKNSSTVHASPMVEVTPRPSILGFGPHSNSGMSSKTEIPLRLLSILSVIFIVFKSN